MTTATTPATAQDMLGLLRRHYLPENRPSAGIFAPEIAAPAGNRRADLIWQGATSAGGNELVGHEVKVSRADLAAELADLTKSDPWQRYCDRWWLVVPSPALIEGFELPPTWGVYAPPSGRRTRSMTVVVPAPKLTPQDQAAAFRTLAVWLHWRLERCGETHRATQAHRDRLEERNRELEAGAPRRQDATRTPLHEVVEQIVRKLGGSGYEPGTVGRYPTELSVDDVVHGLRDIAGLRDAVRRDRGRLQGQANALRRLVAEIDKTDLRDLAKAFAADDEAQRGVSA